MSTPSRLTDLLFLLLIVSLLSAWTVLWPRHGDSVSQDVARFWTYRIKAPLLAQKGVFRGRYTCDLVDEEAPCAFHPCGVNEIWELKGDLRGVGFVRKPGVFNLERYVVLEGKVTPRGRYGHIGLYNRELSVTTVLTAREAQRNDCNS